MRSVLAVVSDDRTARARILDAAVARYAVDGPGASLRAVAADAGVSPALILHHFGSRDGLRAACGERAFARVRDTETATFLSPSGSRRMAELAADQGYVEAVGYLLRTLQAGGEEALRFTEHVVAEMTTLLETGVSRGVVRPSRFPQARARLLAEAGLGALLVQLPRWGSRLDLGELAGWIQRYGEEILGPLVELVTEPLLLDPGVVEGYLDQTTETSTPQELER